ncbi:MAG: sigma-54-dependent Fis family transcriptional regulator [Acidobacteria bacterium]|nr:sigma-54-dependent Fis family transcriptional regulator [Acidobacteriota bacterium]
MPIENNINNTDLSLATIAPEKLELLLKDIYQLGLVICQQTDTESILQESLKVIVNKFKSDGFLRCLIGLVDLDKKSKTIFINKKTKVTLTGQISFTNKVYHFKENDKKIDLDLDEKNWGLSSSSIKRVLTGEQLLLQDVNIDPELNKAESIVLNNIRSVIACPLGPTADNTIGLIYVDSISRIRSFSSIDFYFITAISNYIYLALRSAKNLVIVKNSEEQSKALAKLQQDKFFSGLSPIKSENKDLQKAYEILQKVAINNNYWHQSNLQANKKNSLIVPILLQGETGTGKELFARAGHKYYTNNKPESFPFVAINISSISPSIVESELFGHKAGSFTDAKENKLGFLSIANGGTLFLDEIHKCPLDIQSKLLRVLDSGEFYRVGDTKEPQRSTFWLICASNEDLKDLVNRGQFLQDLYYRISRIEIILPPLRERPLDIPKLIQYTLNRRESTKTFSEQAIEIMQKYNWPGNIRELISVVEAEDVLSEKQLIELADLPTRISKVSKIKSATILEKTNLVNQDSDSTLKFLEKDLLTELYYQVKILSIDQLAISERRDQIPALVQKILRINNSKNFFSSDALEIIKQYPWKDLREFILTIEAIIMLSETTEITLNNLPKKLLNPPEKPNVLPLEEYMKACKREYIEQALNSFGGIKAYGAKTNAAKILGIAKSTLSDLMKDLDIKVDSDNE